MTNEVAAQPQGQRVKKALYMLICLGLAVWLYFDLTAFEAEGGTKSMNSIVAMLYDLGGKWGVVGTFSALAVFFGYVAVTAKS